MTGAKRAIPFEQISVVVQGPVFGDPWARPEKRLTARALRRVREVLPGATIILSTWRGTNVTDLEFDRLVTSEDPGPQPLRIEDGVTVMTNNVNRQIVSTRAGLLACVTPFVLKMRSDLWLEHADFLAEFGRYPARDPELTFVSERVLSSAFHSRTGPERPRYKPYLFHPNDWFYFGRTADVLELWDLPLQTDADARWFQTRPKDPALADYSGHVSRWVAETYLWSQFLKKHVEFTYDSYLDASPELARLSARSIAANLVLLDLKQLKFISLKYPRAHWLTGWANFRGRYTHRDWRVLYRTYADPAAPVPFFDPAPWRFGLSFVAHALGHSLRNLRRGVTSGGRRWLGVDE